MSMDGGQVTQLSQKLESVFFPHIPPPTQPNWTADQIQQYQLTRSLAAFAVSELADVDPITACIAVVDGYDDNGIDAVYFDRSKNCLLLVQSKFKRDGGEPNQAETSAFTVGVKDLLDQKYDRFNTLFQQKIPDLDEALENPDLKILVVLVHLGNELAIHAQRKIDDLLEEVNRDSKLLEYVNFSAVRIMTALTNEHAPDRITANITLEHWSKRQTAPQAIYGQVSVWQLQQLVTEYGKNLFDKNIRYYIGESAVNAAIAETLRTQPEHLFLMNNGLTVICERATKIPNARPEEGAFRVEGLSIVNGAQTVGAIAQVGQTLDLTNSPGRILVTLIELEGQQESLGEQITRARNFQNQVKRDDFAAQDSLQERLRRELAISGIAYHVRSHAEIPPQDDFNITLETASLALATLSNKTEFVMRAKRSPGQLRDPDSSIYRELFSEKLSATELCRKVKIYRYLERMCIQNQTFSDNKANQSFFRHMAHLLMQKVYQDKPTIVNKLDIKLTLDDEKELLESFNKMVSVYLRVTGPYLIEAKGGHLWLSRDLTGLQQVISRANQEFERMSQSQRAGG